MERLDGTDLIGRVIIYIGSLSAHHRERCVVVGYDEEWDRYTIEPLTGTCSRRIQRARRASLVQTKET
ncbi:MAG TPA: hypothetical protein VNS46_15360, partial [Nocardioides sp.]|nr:hypothetical protein [Nocardioides sp.]